jgi:methyl-galactoside transport system permease protein
VEEKKISRQVYSIAFAAAGAAVALLGIAFRGSGLAARQIYDLPIFLMIIGGIIVAYGVWTLLPPQKPGAEIVLSRRAVNAFMLNNAIILALGALVVAIAAIEPRFMQMRVLRDILAQSSTKLIIALGISFTLIIGGTDLSAGRMVGLAAVISASMMQTETYANRFYPNLPQIWVMLPVAAAVAACILFGLLNGFVAASFNLPPFIGTLAIMSVVYGVNSLYFNMPPNNSQPIGGIRPDFAALGQTLLGGEIPVLIPIAAAFAAFVWFLLNHTVFGKNVYAIGGNRQAAVVSGINVKSVILAVFVIAASATAGRYLQVDANGSRVIDEMVPSTGSATAFQWTGAEAELKKGANRIRIYNYKGMESSLESFAAFKESLLAKGGAGIKYSVCEWGGTYPWNWAFKAGGASYRIYSDIKASSPFQTNYGWKKSQYDRAVVLDKFTGLDTAWADCDMMVIGDIDGNPNNTQAKFTYEADKQHFTEWCMVMSPIMLGNDLPGVEPGSPVHEVITNKDAIALSQDPLAVQAKRLKNTGSIAPQSFNGGSRLDLLAKPLANGDVAVMFNNANSSVAQASAARWRAAGRNPLQRQAPGTRRQT